MKTMPGRAERRSSRRSTDAVPGEIARVAKALEREAAWLASLTRDLATLK